jgi:lysylphosphatidylglycerol synthetase-like protein (DUF2156 family)
MSTEMPWQTPLPSTHQDENPQGIAQPTRPAWVTDAVAFMAVAGAGLVAAFPVGALWRSTAPAVLGVVSQGSVYLSAPESKTFVARDGWFALYACIAAVVLALFAFLAFRRRASIGAALALAVGGFAGGYLATWFGKVIGPGSGSTLRAAQSVPSGTNFGLPLFVRATGVVWLWPAVAVGLFFFLMLLFGPSDPEQEPMAFAGWGDEPDGQFQQELAESPQPPYTAPPPASDS